MFQQKFHNRNKDLWHRKLLKALIWHMWKIKLLQCVPRLLLLIYTPLCRQIKRLASIFWLNYRHRYSNRRHRRRRRTFWLYQPYKGLRHCHNNCCSWNECARLLTFSDIEDPFDINENKTIYGTWSYSIKCA